jgi:hypothetical protein
MAIYSIGYDLNRPGQGYSALIEAIKTTFGTWWHHLDSTWLVKTNLSMVQVRDLLNPYLDQNDELLVVELSGGFASHGFNSEAAAWLNNNL